MHFITVSLSLLLIRAGRCQQGFAALFLYNKPNKVIPLGILSKTPLFFITDHRRPAPVAALRLEPAGFFSVAAIIILSFIFFITFIFNF
jgi:hypothetical protein